MVGLCGDVAVDALLLMVPPSLESLAMVVAARLSSVAPSGSACSCLALSATGLGERGGGGPWPNDRLRVRPFRLRRRVRPPASPDDGPGLSPASAARPGLGSVARGGGRLFSGVGAGLWGVTWTRDIQADGQQKARLSSARVEC